MKETVDSVNTKAFSEYQNFNDYDYAHLCGCVMIMSVHNTILYSKMR